MSETQERRFDLDRVKGVPVETVIFALGLERQDGCALRKKRKGDKDEWSGHCPFGARHGKYGCFSIRDKDGVFVCHVCKRKGGNVLEFVKQYMEAHPKLFQDYKGVWSAGIWLENLLDGLEEIDAPAPLEDGDEIDITNATSVDLMENTLLMLFDYLREPKIRRALAERMVKRLEE